MNTLYMTIGLPASGKSTWAELNAKILDAVIVSSDAKRKELHGNESVQGNNNEMFKMLHAKTVELLKDDKNVIFDATNLSRKHRRAFLNQISKLDVNKVAVLFATQYEFCLERNKNRARTVPEDVMLKMYKTFQTPMYQEGWDSIEILWDYDVEEYGIVHQLALTMQVEQDNPNHTKTVGEHLIAVNQYLDTKFDYNNLLSFAGALHDIGKPECKVFHNIHGEPTDIAHYYGHECVGAYKTLFIIHENMFYDMDCLYVSGLVNYHMRPHFTKTEKSRAKLLREVGEEMLKDLMKLHEADKNSR